MASDGGGEVLELSIEETNKLRISLGLKPLVVDNKGEKEKEAAAEREKRAKEAEKERKSLELRNKLKGAKSKRQWEQFLSGKTLGEKEDEDESAAAWVAKARIRQEEEIQKEKLLAEKRAKQFEEEENEETEDKYSSSDLAGLKVAHKLDDVMKETEEPIIFTLKDTSVLKDNSLNTDEDELENLSIAEKERLKHYEELKKKKPGYNALEDSKKAILYQYDDEPEKPSFKIGEESKSAEEQEYEKVKENLALGKTVYDLNVNKSIMGEYYTQDELEKLKKKTTKKKKTTGEKKKKSLRKKTTTSEIITDMVIEDGGNKSKDHGSRVDVQSTKDEEILEALLKNKEKIAKTKEEFSKQIAERAAQPKKEEDKDVVMKGVQEELVFTDTTEFIQRLQPIEEPRVKTKPAITKKPKDAMEVDDEQANADLEEHQKMLRAQAQKEKASRPPTEKKVEEDAEEGEVKKEDKMVIEKKEEKVKKEKKPEKKLEEETITAEPLAGSSVAAAIALLKRKGPEPMETWVGRKNDKKVDIPEEKLKDPAPHIRLDYLDEHGRLLTPKEAFRQLSHRFHGKKPGKNKQEKQLRLLAEDAKRKQMKANDTPLSSLQAMQMEQEKLQSPYIVLTGSSASFRDTEPKDLQLKKNAANVGTKRAASSSTAKSSGESSVSTPASNEVENAIMPLPAGGGLKVGEFREFKLSGAKKQKKS